MTTFFRFLTLATLVATLAGTASAASNQSITDLELQRFASHLKFPSGCGAASQSAGILRSKPTTDPAVLNDAVVAYRACATGPYGIGSNALRNQSYFAASAASLLAARHEPPGPAHDNALIARQASQVVIDYRRPQTARTPYTGPDLSQLITDAGRINRDARALLASLANAAH